MEQSTQNFWSTLSGTNWTEQQQGEDLLNPSLEAGLEWEQWNENRGMWNESMECGNTGMKIGECSIGEKREMWNESMLML